MFFCKGKKIEYRDSIVPHQIFSQGIEKTRHFADGIDHFRTVFGEDTS